MTIRTRLVVSTFLLQVFSMALLGWGVLAVRRQFQDRELHQSAALIEMAVERAASDALIQKDDVALLSYMKFLQVQYPAITQARILWKNKGRERAATVGLGRFGAQVRESRFTVADPADPQRTVEVDLALDYDVLDAPFWDANRRLTKIILAVWGGTSLLGLLVSFLIARGLTMPIVELSRLAGEIGGGKLGGKLAWESDDELGGLVRAFNGMSGRLEEFDSIKRNFVSSVTHELRSPLGAIESFLQLIREKMAGGTPEGYAQSKDFLERIQVNVRRLSGFINDLLDVAKIEKGKMECVLRPMELPVVANEVCQFFEAKALQQGVSIQNRLAVLPAVMGDADRVRQVLVNLIANGLKFTASGGQVWITGEQFRDGGARWIEITVGDTGRGMDEADRSRLFQPFTQGRNVSEGVAGHKGTGLGLYIVKSIVDQHGGKIEVKSTPGQGTRISFSLKVAA
ncbi:MAG: HAMP domain-containing sensor histidine kinase [Elusimicrobia bacterium]|nr:HAMP domain-containing sensor histidine kinase [Elusimicrobiota bacterium]